METAALLRELTQARGPSGYEEEVRALIQARFAEHAHDVRVDAMGNCIARIPATAERADAAGNAPSAGTTPSGTTPALMLTAHMDEVALMVTQVEKGFLRVTQVGGFDPRVLLGQEVIVHGRRELNGLVVSVPPHFTAPAEREKPVPLEKLFIDVGLDPGEAPGIVRVGDLVTLRARWTELSSGCVACKSMDDRAAMVSIILCLEELSRRTHAWDVLAVATAQEEIGCRGAVTGAFGVDPAAAIALDATFAMQPGLSASETVRMDGGPSIAMGPNFNARLSDRLVEAAKAIELPCQVEPIPAESGTDAWRIQVSREGIPCALIGIPVKFMHTPVETVCLRDVERAGRLLAEAICRLPADFAASLETRDALAAGRA
jgi:tetrahedral aminopeptidase